MRPRPLTAAVVALVCGTSAALLTGATAASAATTYAVRVSAPPLISPQYPTTTINATNQATGQTSTFRSGGINGQTSGSLQLAAGTYDFFFSSSASNPIGEFGSYTVQRRGVVVDQDTQVVAPTAPTRKLHFRDVAGEPAKPGYVRLGCSGPQADTGSDVQWQSYSRTWQRTGATADLVLGGYAAVSPCALDASFPQRLDLTAKVDLATFAGDQTIVLPRRHRVSVEVPAPPHVQASSSGVGALSDDGWWRTGAVDGDPHAVDAPEGGSLVTSRESTDDWLLVHQQRVNTPADTAVQTSISWASARLHAVGPDGVDRRDPDGTMLCEREQDGARTVYTLVPGVPDVHVPTGPGWTCRIRFSAPPGDQEGDTWVDRYSRTVQPAASGNEWTWISGTTTLLDGPPTASADADGVPDQVEDLGPDGGDGNHDGTPDSAQPEVATLPAHGLSPYPSYAAMTVAGPSGSSLVGVSTRSVESIGVAPPAGVSLPHGVASFTVRGIPAGSTRTVSIYPPSMEGINGYAKYDPGTGAWSVLPPDRVTTTSDHVEVRLTDGGIGDADGTADGKIVDPGGVAVVPVPSDTTPPTVTGVATTAPNAAGWYAGDVTVRWTATDADSGVAAAPADTVVRGEGADLTATSPRVCDTAEPANCTTGTLPGLRIDRTAPAVAPTGVGEGATYVLGSTPRAGCAATDELSGLASCTVSTTGGNSNGVGSFTTTATATDKAGNTSTASVGYRVVYRFDGFQQPVNDPALGPGTPVSVFKVGNTVPLVFSLRNAAGQVVLPRALPRWVAPVRGAATKAAVNESVSSGGGSTGSTYLPVSLTTWRYDWSTKGLSGGYLYTVGVSLDDGTTHTVVVGLR